MIFVTVGSDVPFNRLVEYLDGWARRHPAEKIVAQVGRLGPSDYRPTSMQWTEMIPADRFDRHCAEARLIVAHAGMGSIISALSAARPIVILPRLARLKETRSDHQFATAERFAGRPSIFVAWTEGDLDTAIDKALDAAGETAVPALERSAAPAFTDRLRAFILDAGPGGD